MTNDARNNCIDFIELPASSKASLLTAKRFYQTVLGWSFKDWGDDYADTQSAGVSTGINADADHKPLHPLVIIYSSDLEGVREKVLAADAKISKEIFSFPGGRRFHFLDPAGNELAIWSDR